MDSFITTVTVVSIIVLSLIAVRSKKYFAVGLCQIAVLAIFMFVMLK
jgi:hypothetical protein